MIRETGPIRSYIIITIMILLLCRAPAERRLYYNIPLNTTLELLLYSPMPRRDDDSRSPNIHNIKELVVPPPEPPSAYQDASAIGPKSHLYTLHIHTHTIYI